MFIVHIREETTKTRKERFFTISQDTREDFFRIVSTYINLRPSASKHRNNSINARFFLNHQHQRQPCTNQPIGITKLRKIPKQIATELACRSLDDYSI